jgi:hypothetical protein
LLLVTRLESFREPGVTRFGFCPQKMRGIYRGDDVYTFEVGVRKTVEGRTRYCNWTGLDADVSSDEVAGSHGARKERTTKAQDMAAQIAELVRTTRAKGETTIPAAEVSALRTGAPVTNSNAIKALPAALEAVGVEPGVGLEWRDKEQDWLITDSNDQQRTGT